MSELKGLLQCLGYTAPKWTKIECLGGIFTVFCSFWLIKDIVKQNIFWFIYVSVRLYKDTVNTHKLCSCSEATTDSAPLVTRARGGVEEPEVVEEGLVNTGLPRTGELEESDCWGEAVRITSVTHIVQPVIASETVMYRHWMCQTAQTPSVESRRYKNGEGQRLNWRYLV